MTDSVKFQRLKRVKVKVMHEGARKSQTLALAECIKSTSVVVGD